MKKTWCLILCVFLAFAFTMYACKKKEEEEARHKPIKEVSPLPEAKPVQEETHPTPIEEFTPPPGAPPEPTEQVAPPGAPPGVESPPKEVSTALEERNSFEGPPVIEEAPPTMEPLPEEGCETPEEPLN